MCVFISSDESILLFEYFTANGMNDDEIFSEALTMIKSLTDDLSNLNINLLVFSEFVDYFKEFEVNIIPIDIPLDKWLKKYSKDFDSVIFIADEGDNHLYTLTKILEDNNLKLYCSNSKSVYKSSDKFITYNNLNGKVKQPNTFKINLDNNFEDNIKYLLNKFNNNLIIKPINGVDCEKVHKISSINDIKYLKDYDNISEVLIQEFIPGEPCSVSLITDGENILPLSLNKQNIHLNKNINSYNGGMLPYNHKLKEKAYNLAINAVKNTEGLKGFVGVDLILEEDDVTFIEINSRFTTPYVGLKSLSNINIGEAIFKLLNNELNIKKLKENFTLNGEVEFLKIDNNIKLNKKG